MRTIVRSAAALAAGALLIPALATPADAASPSGSAGNWLARQVKTGVVSGQFGNDYGLTADTALALKSLGGHKKTLRKIRKELATGVDTWTSPGTEVYAGSVAKAAVTAKALGAKPRSYGGANLIKQLHGTVTPSGPAKGRIRDTSQYGDYANTIGQAYAVRALSAAHSPKTGSVVRFLLAQQCAGGYFRLYFAAPTATTQGCVAGDPATSAPDTDATAVALMSLDSLRKPNAKVRNAIKKATRWLKRQQRANGSFVGGPTTSTPNANSTGLAGAALGELGACQQARKAARWVKRLQVAKPSGALKGQKGAIAYDRAALTAATTAGITDANRDQWRRATAQAAPALRFLHGCSR
jgi:hypothetical protein